MACTAAVCVPAAVARPGARCSQRRAPRVAPVSIPHRACTSTSAHRAAARRDRPAHGRLAPRASAGNGANGAADVENVVIIGSGPAGYTAAIYAARANLRPLVFEGVNAGGVRGGQLMTTTEVENFPGFPEGITGPDLMDRMRAQAERWGAQLNTEDVESVDFSARPFTVRGTDTTVRAHSVIVATGATAKRLGIPSEQQYWSAGISACAICDGASAIFKGQPLAVVGGGDTATEEALYLTKYASHVHLLVRGEAMRASRAMQDRVNAHPDVTVHLSTEIDDAFGDGKLLTGLHLRNAKTGEKSDLAVKGLFYGIGHTPNSDILGGAIELDAGGYVKVRDSCKTNVEGVFSAGDLHDTEWRQAITAAGSGCMAALAAERYLSAAGLATIHTQQEQPAEAAQSAAPASGGAAAGGAAADAAATFDISADCHRGQYALRKLYHESDRPLVVLYTAPSCGPCRTLKPIMAKVIADYPGQVHYVELDTEADPDMAEAAGVQGTPTVQIFKDKERKANLPGVKMKREYKALIEQYLAAPVAAQ